MRTERTELTKHITDADLRGIPTECQAYGRRIYRRNAWSDAGLFVLIGSLAVFALRYFLG